MEHSQLNVLDSGVRVQGFLVAESAHIGIPVPATLRSQLDAAVTQVTAFQLEQETLSGTIQGHTTNQEAMRKELCANLLRPMGKVARFALRDVTDFAALVVPASVSRNGDFLTKVSTAADAAAKYEQKFIEHGLPADFIAQMRAAVTQLSASKDERALQVGRKSAATEGIAASTKTLRSVLRALDGVLTPALRKNKPLLANWNATKRIKATVVNPLPTGDASDTGSTPVVSAGTNSTPVVPAALPVKSAE